MEPRVGSNSVAEGERGAVQKPFFYGVEAGYKGPVPVSLLKGALLIDGNDYKIFKRHQGFDDELFHIVENFSGSLTPDPELSAFEKAFEKNKAR